MTATILPLPGIRAPVHQIAHYLRIGHTGHRQLEKLPNLSRTRHFLETDMTNADQLARRVQELKTGDESLTNRLIDHSRKVEAKRAVLENLYELRGDSNDRAPEAIRRGNGGVGDRQNRG